MKDLTYKELVSFEEMNKYIEEYFDAGFWEDFSNEGIYEYYIECGCKIILVEEYNEPIALLVYEEHKSSGDLLLENKYEIVLFEISDTSCGKEMGFGKKVINYFKNNIAIGKDICGYSLPGAAPFWCKVATEIDEEVYEYLEAEDFEGDIMMYFRIENK